MAAFIPVPLESFPPSGSLPNPASLQQIRLEKISGGFYIGKAKLGVATSEASWQLYKYTELQSLLPAAAFAAWDDRASVSYG